MQQWFIQLEDGRVAGPFTTEAVLLAVQAGVFGPQTPAALSADGPFRGISGWRALAATPRTPAAMGAMSRAGGAMLVVAGYLTAAAAMSAWWTLSAATNLGVGYTLGGVTATALSLGGAALLAMAAVASMQAARDQGRSLESALVWQRRVINAISVAPLLVVVILCGFWFAAIMGVK